MRQIAIDPEDIDFDKGRCSDYKDGPEAVLRQVDELLKAYGLEVVIYEGGLSDEVRFDVKPIPGDPMAYTADDARRELNKDRVDNCMRMNESGIRGTAWAGGREYQCHTASNGQYVADKVAEELKRRGFTVERGPDWKHVKAKW